MIHVESFYAQLSPIISKYSDNLLEFSKGTQCSKTTLWRWMNGINSTYPDPNKLLSVLEKDSGLRGKRKIANYYGGGAIKYFLIESFPLFFSGEIEETIQPEKINEITDFYSFVILNICGSYSGANEQEIIDLIGNVAARKSGLENEDLTPDLLKAHGKIAKKKVKKLFEDGLIIKDSNSFYHLQDKSININNSNSGAFLGDIISSFFKAEEAEAGLNSLFFTIDTVTEEAARKIAKMQKDSFMKCYNIMKKNQTSSGVPISVINFSDRIEFSPLIKEGGL